MAARKNGNTNGVKQVQGFVKHQIEEAKEQFVALETEAKTVLENLIERGQKSRKEVETLLNKFNAAESLQNGIDQIKDLNPIDRASVKKLSKRASAASTEVRKRLDDLQNRVISGVGVASQSQVREINKELVKLSKKLDTLVGKKAASSKSEPRN